MCYSRNKRLKFGSKPKWGSELNQIIKDFVLHNELSWDKHEDSFYLKKFKKSRRQVIDHYDNFLR